MDFETYALEAKIEETHWWYVGRRSLFAREIGLLAVTPAAEVLDIGCSTGTNLRLARQLGLVRTTGLDVSETAIAFCEDKGLGPVRKGSITQIPFADASFDLVLATDIIEHVEADAAALAEVRRVLKPGGHVLISVPAFQSLWGNQDIVGWHVRRYRMGQLLRQVESAGLVVGRHFYFNYLLFIPIWVVRKLYGLLKLAQKSEVRINTPWLNRILTWLFRWDVRTAEWLHPPFGVSILAIAAKPRA